MLFGVVRRRRLSALFVVRWLSGVFAVCCLVLLVVVRRCCVSVLFAVRCSLCVVACWLVGLLLFVS